MPEQFWYCGGWRSEDVTYGDVIECCGSDWVGIVINAVACKPTDSKSNDDTKNASNYPSGWACECFAIDNTIDDDSREKS